MQLSYYKKERLRTKILNRLSKEGSSADEPLNIPLSDYSSDEGDTSSDSSENEANKSGYEGPCCQPLKVPPSSPVLPPKLKGTKKYRKVKQKKAIGKAKEPKQRSVLDIPIKDPSQDFVYSSTEDEYDGDGVKMFKNSSTVRKSPISVTMQGDVLNIKMPPELIITSAKKTDDESGGERGPFELLRSERKITFSEFPPIGTLTVPKRTKSWNNLTHSMSSLKISDHENAESLQMKLSLKKQIWTGTWNESAIDRTRPLSWGVSASTSGVSGGGGAVIKSTSQYLEVREYDSEQLLIACSKKLAAWQENGNRQVSQPKGKSQSHEKKLNRDGAAKRSQKGFHVSTASFINRCNITRISELSKTKKLPQNYALAKIVEATDFITGLNKKSSSNSQKSKKILIPPPPQLPTTSQDVKYAAGNLQATSTMSHMSRSRTNLALKKKTKFKTGGIVVTAVQGKPSRKPTKRIRSILPGRANGNGNGGLLTVGEDEQQRHQPAIRSSANRIKNLVKINIRSKLDRANSGN